MSIPQILNLEAKSFMAQTSRIDSEIEAFVTNPQVKSHLNALCSGSQPSRRPLLPLEICKEHLFDIDLLTNFSLSNDCWNKNSYLEEVSESGSFFESSLVILSRKIEISEPFGLKSIADSLNTTFDFLSANSQFANFAIVGKFSISMELDFNRCKNQPLSSCLTDNASRDLNSINSIEDAYRIIDRYGTYFHNGALFGGQFTLSSVDVTKLSKDHNSIKEALNESLIKNFGSGNMDLSALINSTKDKLGVTAKTTATMLGGYAYLVLRGNVNDWVESTRTDPAIIGYKLCPIYELLPHGSSTRKFLEEAVREFILRTSPYDDIIRKLASYIPPTPAVPSIPVVPYMRNHKNKDNILNKLAEGRDYTNHQAAEAQSWMNKHSWFGSIGIKRNENWRNAANSYNFGSKINTLMDKTVEEFRRDMESCLRDSDDRGRAYWGFGGHDSEMSNSVHNQCKRIYSEILSLLN